MIKDFLVILFSVFLFCVVSNSYSQYGQALCSHPEFTCIKINKIDTWQEKWPDFRERDLIMRLNRTNLPLAKFQWVLVPKNLSTISLLNLAPFPLKITPSGDKLIIVDLAELAFGAFDAQGHLVYWGPISGGKEFCEDLNQSCKTPLGVYRVYRIKGKEAISSQFPTHTNGGAPMPYCMRFHKGLALHGSKSLPGRHDSHGCVRLYTDDAKWINEKFVKIGTEIKIIDSNKLAQENN